MTNEDFLFERNDKIIQGIGADGTVRCFAAITTGIVAEAAQRHATAPTATAAFGRLLTGTLLLGASYKDFDRLTVRVESNGIIEGIVAESNAKGHVRGYVKNPDADLPFNELGKLDVGGIVGEGMFHVTRESGFDIGLYKEPYKGSVPLVSGELGEDFAYYLAKSEQIPSAVLLGVLLHPGQKQVLAAGGVLIQMMPGADDKVITEIETAIQNSPATTTLISEGANAHDLLKYALGKVEFEILEEKNVAFTCTCSYERAVSLISSINKIELESMLREDKGATMICHFCNNKYVLGEAELEKMLAQK
ncbi:MAG: Hsp33 family molecular chaperone HslO [Pyrinomonadaceae bacterium]|nr:Hsp33 family molecular chaperone HslO [Pyrinomonadaceae bacterium]